MRRTLLLALPLVAIFPGLAAGQVSDDVADRPVVELDFDLPGEELGGLVGDGGVDLGDADFEGNPMRGLAEKWPDDLVIAPIPGRSPQLGWQLTLAGGYFLGNREEGDKTPPSVIGGFAMFADNGSTAYGAGTYLHLREDDLRIQAGVAYGDVRYRFYGIGNDVNRLGISLDILQEMTLFFTTATYRVWNRLYLGLGYAGGTVDTEARIVIPDPNLVNPLGELDIGAIMIPIEFDTRDHEQFPRGGVLVQGRAMLYSDGAGSDFDADTFLISGNYYLPVRERDVLASRAMVRWTNGDAPFFLLSTFGGSTDLRGYPSGRYRDRMMYAVQSEYRWQFNDKWIFTGFAGVGEVADSFSNFGKNFLPAAGVGARFVLSQKHRVALSFDVAQGKDGTEYYFGVGEAF